MKIKLAIILLFAGLIIFSCKKDDKQPNPPANTGGGGGGGNPAPANTAEIRISNETIPAGGTVQVKFSLTEPHPITSTGSNYALDGMSVDGVALWSPVGDAGGIGLVKNDSLYINAISPSGSLGNGLDYPFLTITSDIPASVKTGTSFPLTWSSDSWLSTATGPMNISIKPGTLVIGGSISIRGVYPGGGTWPAGTLIRVLGTGFSSTTRLTTKFGISSITVVSANEIDVILRDQTTLDSQQFIAVNKDNSTSSYFSYLRGVLIKQPSRDLLQRAEPAFPLQTHALASLVVPALTASQFAGLALQNPNPGPLVVTFELDSASGGIQVASVILPSGTRLVDDVSSLMNGAVVNPGDTFRLTSTAPLQILGLLGDESAVTVAPFFPSF
jgi:hypothetical protein